MKRIKATKKSPGTGTVKKPPPDIEAVLRDLMKHSKSAAARIAAARLLYEMKKIETENHDADRHEAETRAAAIAELETILAELADAKSDGGAVPCALDPDGAPEPADA